MKTKVSNMPIKVAQEKRKAPAYLTEMDIHFLEEQEDKLARIQEELKMKTEEIMMINRIKIKDLNMIL